MYVPFGKSVDDVTFRLSLHQFFCPRLKKAMEHNQQCIFLAKFPTFVQLVHACFRRGYFVFFVDTILGMVLTPKLEVSVSNRVCFYFYLISFTKISS